MTVERPPVQGVGEPANDLQRQEESTIIHGKPTCQVQSEEGTVKITDSHVYEGFYIIKRNRTAAKSVLFQSETSTALSQEKEQCKKNTLLSAKNFDFDSECTSLTLQQKDTARTDGLLYKRGNTLSHNLYQSSSLNSAGITETSECFSGIGEWLKLNLDITSFEQEEAIRTMYLRQKGTQYRELEPERCCIIL